MSFSISSSVFKQQVFILQSTVMLKRKESTKNSMKTKHFLFSYINNQEEINLNKFPNVWILKASATVGR